MEKEVLITHVFDATRELVFKAWTDPEWLAQWYAPDNCSIIYKKLDISVGGSFHSCIKNPDYPDCWVTGEYKEITQPERLVFTSRIADENGNTAAPIDANKNPDWPAETVTTVTFREISGKTEVTLHQTVSEILAKETGAYPSWLQMLERLDELLLQTTTL